MEKVSCAAFLFGGSEQINRAHAQLRSFFDVASTFIRTANGEPIFRQPDVFSSINSALFASEYIENVRPAGRVYLGGRKHASEDCYLKIRDRKRSDKRAGVDENAMMFQPRISCVNWIKRSLIGCSFLLDILVRRLFPLNTSTVEVHGENSRACWLF